jgi:capsular polysaccharide biosynthesis protein
MRISFRQPGSLADLPASRKVMQRSAHRILAAPATRLELRRPAFLELPSDRQEVLRRNFDVAQLVVPDVWGYALDDVMSLGENIVVMPDRSFLESTFSVNDASLVRTRAWHSDLVRLDDATFESAILDRDRFHVAEPALWLGTAGVALYHHWLCDAVTKIGLLDDDERARLVVAVPAHVPSAWLELLRAFDIDDDRVVRTPMDRPTMFRRLLLLPRVATASVMIPELLERLRLRVTSRAPRAPGVRRLFVGRRDSPEGTRQLLNEDAVVQLFLDRGYEVCYPGADSPFGQASLFAAADLIVAVHGSGAANVVFTPAGARVMHLHPADATAFRQHGQMSAIRGQLFGYIFGDCFSNAARLHNVEWLVDVATVERVADEFGF